MMRLRSLMLIFVLIVSAHSQNASGAAIGPGCELFYYQEEAQYYLERTVSDYPSLIEQATKGVDPDGNGVACDDLPFMPSLGQSQFSGRGLFEGGIEAYGKFRITTCSLTFSVAPAGVLVESESCSTAITDDVLNDLIVPDGERVRPAIVVPDQEVDLATGPTDIKGLIWLPISDPQQPLLLNEWMLSNGLAKFDPNSAPDDFSDRLQAAETIAKESGLGLWGNCEPPTALEQSLEKSYIPMVDASGNGDQVIQFSVTEGNTYLLTLNAGGGSAVVFFVDVYFANGTPLYQFSISTAESGNFTSAGWLDPGNITFRSRLSGRGESHLILSMTNHRTALGCVSCAG